MIFTIALGLSALPQKYINLKTYNTDSLLLLLPHQTGIQRVNSLNCLAVSLSIIDYDSSMRYADEAMQLAKNLNYREGMAVAYRNYGHIYLYQGEYPKAINNYWQSELLFEQLGMRYEVAWTKYWIATTHYFASNYDKSIEYGYDILEVFRERDEQGNSIGSAKDTLIIYGAFGEIYIHTGDLQKSLQCNLSRLEGAKGKNYSNAEMVLFEWRAGLSYAWLGQYDSAEIYYKRALAYPDENKRVKSFKCQVLTSVGFTFLNAKEFDSAVYYFQTPFNFYYENGLLMWAQMACNNIGLCYLKKADTVRAEKFYRLSLSITEEMVQRQSWFRDDTCKKYDAYGIDLWIPVPPVRMEEIAIQELIKNYSALFRICNTTGRTDEALKYHIALAGAKDSLYRLQQRREIIELETKYETERNEEQIAFLSQQNALQELRLSQSRYLTFGLAGLVLLAFSFTIVLIRQEKLRSRQQTLVLQQKLFRSQMNPHFIFNSLTSIQNYILDEEAHQASKYLSRFSKLVRNILDSSVEEFVSLDEEISTIENYLELQKLRFKDKFEFSIEVDEKINPESINIPPMLAQPFIENAIEHGIKHKETKGHIYIRFYQKNSQVVCEVEDDGVGREKAREILYGHDKDHRSLATSITMERIRVLNKKLRNKINLFILDLTDERNNPSGTLVRINIPSVY